MENFDIIFLDFVQGRHSLDLDCSGANLAPFKFFSLILVYWKSPPLLRYENLCQSSPSSNVENFLKMGYDIFE